MQRRMVHGSGYYGESPVKVTLPVTSNLGGAERSWTPVPQELVDRGS